MHILIQATKGLKMEIFKRLYERWNTQGETEMIRADTPIVESYSKVTLSVEIEGKRGYLELNNINKYSNQNCMVTGGTGSGKTVTITEMTSAYLKNPNTKAIILDYKQDYKEHAETFGATYENINDVSIGYNPLYIPLERDDANFKRALRDTVYGFSNKIASVYPIMGGKQKGELRMFLNDYIIDIMGNGNTPNVRGLYDYISDNIEEGKNVGAWVSDVLEPIVDYTIFTHKPITFHDYMETHSRVIIDVSELDIEYQLLISLFIVDDLKREMMERLGKAETVNYYRQMKYILVIDEAFKIVKSKNNSFKDFIQKSRQYGVGIILGFQSFRDATANKEIDWEELLSLTFQGRSIKETALASLPLGTFVAKSSRLDNVEVKIIKTV